jgi:hypothetical protein
MINIGYFKVLNIMDKAFTNIPVKVCILTFLTFLAKYQEVSVKTIQTAATKI